MKITINVESALLGGGVVLAFSPETRARLIAWASDIAAPFAQTDVEASAASQIGDSVGDASAFLVALAGHLPSSSTVAIFLGGLAAVGAAIALAERLLFRRRCPRQATAAMLSRTRPAARFLGLSWDIAHAPFGPLEFCNLDSWSHAEDVVRPHAETALLTSLATEHLEADVASIGLALYAVRSEPDASVGILAAMPDHVVGSGPTHFKGPEFIARMREANPRLYADYERAAEEIGRRHAYPATRLLALLEAARRDAVVPMGLFHWLRLADSTLWYALNNLGRPAMHPEGLAQIAHFEAEKRAGVAVLEPAVAAAVEALVQHGSRRIGSGLGEEDALNDGLFDDLTDDEEWVE